MSQKKRVFKNQMYFQSKPWFPLLIFLVGIVLTLIAAYYVDRVADAKDKLLLERSVVQTKEAIDKRLDTYIAILRSGGGLFATQQEITREEFHEYVSLLRLDNRYRGVQGIGFSIKFSQSQLDTIIQQMREQGDPDFVVFPDYARSEYHTVIFIEPTNTRNQAAIGYDMSTERVRRVAMEEARDRGAPIATGKVTLIQEIETEKQPGFIIYMPVYYGNGIPTTLADRRELLYGYVYSPFRSYDFFEGVFGTGKYDTDLYVFEGPTMQEDNLLYSRSGHPLDRKTRNFELSSTTSLTFAGRTWTIFIVPNGSFVASFERTFIPFILGGGFLINFILFLLSRLQFDARVRAERLATELFESRLALQSSEGRLRRIVDANVIGVFFADFDGRVIEANDAFLQIVGYSKKELQNGEIDFHTLIAPEYRKQSQKVLQEAKKKGFHAPYEKEYIRKDGTRIPVLVGTAYMKGRGEERISLVVDLTERKRLERQKDEFISIASHELKTPVTSLKAYAQVLAKRFSRQGDTESASHLAKMDSQLDRLTNLIKDLLDVTKIQAGKLQFQKELFDSNDLIAEIVEEMQRTTERHDIVVKGRVKHLLLGDRERVGQVLINLLSNAIKYSPHAKKIDITLEEEKNNIIVTVRDYGVGIPKHMQYKVFDRFFRVSGNKEETFPGLGLGLYISSEIIRRQRGKIWVKSEVGKGSAFSFSLPFATQKREM